MPSSSGSDSTDPNMVASYLDNELDPDAVAEFEKKCLTSDVNLAEVASVHQILSLLGQKVKVPAAAKTRMYQLVKGREAIRPRKPRAGRSEIARAGDQADSTMGGPRSTQTLLDPSGSGQRAVCLLLIGLSSVSAWWSLTAPPPEAFQALPIPAQLVKGKSVAKTAPLASGSGPVAHAENVGDGAAELAHPPQSADSGGQPSKPEVDGLKAAQASDATAKSKEAAPPPAASPGSVGLAAATDGILLRYNPDQRIWERLKGPTPLAPSNRLLCLAPFRATVTLGKVQIVLVGESEVRILPQSTSAAPALELMQGRLLLPQQPPGSLRVGFFRADSHRGGVREQQHGPGEVVSPGLWADHDSDPRSGDLLHQGRTCGILR